MNLTIDHASRFDVPATWEGVHHSRLEIIRALDGTWFARIVLEDRNVWWYLTPRREWLGNTAAEYFPTAESALAAALATSEVES